MYENKKPVAEVTPPQITKIYIFLLFISKCISTKDITWFIDAFKKDPEKSSWSELNLYKQM